MKVLVTGLGGTVGRALAAALPGAIGWDRSSVPIDRWDAIDGHIAAIAPDAVVNLAIASRPTGRSNESWLVNHDWPSELAWSCRQRGIRFVHASSVMVFSPHAAGPITVDALPDAPDGYGYEKRMAEARVRHQYPHATIVRLGWQIGDAPGSNNMIDFFDRQMREHGRIAASSRFFPACSYLADTAAAIVRALDAPPGLYQIDANERHSFHAIARALAARHGWTVVETDDVVQDQRMIDPRLGVAPLATRLPGLA